MSFLALPLALSVLLGAFVDWRIFWVGFFLVVTSGWFLNGQHYE